MLSFRLWLDRVTDRRPVIRPSRSRRGPWRRRSARAWLLLGSLLALIAISVALLGRHSPAQAEPAARCVSPSPAFVAASDEQPASP